MATCSSCRAFTNGGVVSNIDTYRWDGGANGAFEPDPHRLLPTAADCKTTGANDNSLRDRQLRNESRPHGRQQQTSKNGEAGQSLRSRAEFFEGGLNLTATGDSAASVSTRSWSDTRSSAESLTATLFDYSLGHLGRVRVDHLSRLRASRGPTTDSGVGHDRRSYRQRQPHRHWNLDVQRDDHVEHLSGPLGLATTSNCFSGGGAGRIASSGSQRSWQSVRLEPAVTITSAGRYCWRAVFSGDSGAGVPASSDARASECFQITPRQPTLSTTAVDANGDPIGTTAQTLGSTIYDKATLGNTANQPGSGGPTGSNGSINPTVAGAAAAGTITFKLYGPDADGVIADQAACTALPLATGFPPAGISVNVSGNNTYGGPPTVGFQPASPGFYYWKAEYSGNLPNTLTATHNGDCTASAEKVEILQLQPAISTAQSFVPNDSATITVAGGAGDLAGSVVFKLYVNDADCSGAAAYTTNPAISIASGTGSGTSRTVVSNNTTSYSTTGTTFHWVVEYTNTNPGHKNVTSACGVEHSSITIDNDGP